MNFILFVLFSSFQLMLSSAFAREKNCKIFNKDLQREVLEMTEKEQDLRIRWINAIVSATEEILRREVLQIDNLHLSDWGQVCKTAKQSILQFCRPDPIHGDGFLSRS